MFNLGGYEWLILLVMFLPIPIGAGIAIWLMVRDSRQQRRPPTGAAVGRAESAPQQPPQPVFHAHQDVAPPAPPPAAELPTTCFCPNCGAPGQTRGRFCSQCGQKIP